MMGLYCRCYSVVAVPSSSNNILLEDLSPFSRYQVHLKLRDGPVYNRSDTSDTVYFSTSGRVLYIYIYFTFQIFIVGDLDWFLDKLAHGFWSVLAQLEATRMTDVMVLVFLLLVWVLVLSVFFKRWGETLCSWMNYGSCVLNKRMMMLQEKFATWFHISRTSQHTFRIYHIKWKGSTLKRRPRALTLSFVTDAKIRSSFRLYISLVLALVGHVWRMAYDLWLMISDLQCMTLNL